MTGPEHYAEAERVIQTAKNREITAGEAQSIAAVALVHAMLAGVYAHNRATTELTGLLHAMLDQIRELREGAAP